MKKILTIITLAATMAASAQSIAGGDISLIPAYESAGTKHLDADGKAISDLVTYFRDEVGMNAMRVRLFVEPNSSDPAVCQDLAYVQKLGKRIKDAGLQFMLDFHYSDSWADPSSQSIPASWKKNTANEALTDSVYQYTKRCLTHLCQNGATPDYIQIGNEITYGMLWRNDNDKAYTTTSQTASSAQWTRLSAFLNAGAKAVREVTPKAQIIIHTERSGSAEQTRKYYKFLNDNKVEYDIIGLSYYPFWHGYLTDLAKTLDALKSDFPSTPVQIVETAYYHNWYPTDATYKTTGTWAATAAGQGKFITDLMAELKKHDNVNGIYYWCPEEAGNGKNKKVMNGWMNRGFWWEDSQWPVTEAINAFKASSASSVSQVECDNHDVSTIYDLTGRVADRPSKGIYIRGNRKFIVQ